jgi:hypothetical protein
MRNLNLPAICLLFMLGLVSCGSGKKHRESSTEKLTDSLPRDYDPSKVEPKKEKPVYIVRNNHIDWDSIFPHTQVIFGGDLSHFDVFESYQDKFPPIEFEDGMLIRGNDSLHLNTAKILGEYFTDSSYYKRVNYLVIAHNGEIGSSISIISIDSSNTIIDFLTIGDLGGDAGYVYKTYLKRIKKIEYEKYAFDLYYHSSDSLEVEKEEKYKVILLDNGMFDEKLISAKKPYFVIGKNAIKKFEDKLE